MANEKPAVADVVKGMEATVTKWKKDLAEAAKGQDAEFVKTCEDATRAADALMELVMSLGPNRAWMQLGILLGLQCILSGKEFTNTMSGLITAVALNKQIMVFDSPDQMALMMGKSAGRG